MMGGVHLLGDLIAARPLRLPWPWSDRNFVLDWTGDFHVVVPGVSGMATGLAAADELRDRAGWAGIGRCAFCWMSSIG